MQRLNKSEKDKVAQFQSISGTSVATAIHCLQASNWTSELALDIFFSNDFPEAAAEEDDPEIDEDAIAQVFDTYKDKQQVSQACIRRRSACAMEGGSFGMSFAGCHSG